MATPRREEKKNRERQARAARLAAERRRKRNKVLATFVVLAIVVTLVGGLISGLGFGADGDDSAGPTTTSTTVPLTPCPAADGSSPRTIDFQAGMSTCIDPSKKYTATFDTTEGRVVVDLDTTKTPKTVNNFVALSRYHYYDNTTIFRTDPSIDIIQAGSPHTQSASDRGPGYNIDDEGDGFEYSEGDVVMARSSGPNSASAQIFMATGPNVAQLNSQGTYVTFGRTSQGIDVLKKIIGLHQPGGELGGAPSRTVTINTVTINES